MTGRERPDRPGSGIVIAPIARIVADRDGGWLVVTHRGHGWVHGSRRAALQEQSWLDAQWRRMRR
jgi:hypothetical protein